MKQVFTVLTISFLLTSCATILNRAWTTSSIYTTEPSSIVFNKDTLRTIGNKAKVEIERKNEPIQIIAITDRLEKKVVIDPGNSFAYYYNIFTNYGLGMFIDKSNPKRYTYPSRVYLNSSDTIGKYFKYGPANKKGELLLHLSLPHINSFHLTPENEGAQTSIGFWGISVGLDYYHSRNQFVNVSLTGVTDFFLPFPAAVDLSGEYDLMSSRYVSISNNHKIKRFSVGYGLCYAKNTWDHRYYEWLDPPPPTRDPVMKSNQALGLVFSSYIQTGPNFNIGVIYRPTFIRLNSAKMFEYEHLISIDLAWKIRLKK